MATTPPRDLLEHLARQFQITPQTHPEVMAFLDTARDSLLQDPPVGVEYDGRGLLLKFADGSLWPLAFSGDYQESATMSIFSDLSAATNKGAKNSDKGKTVPTAYASINDANVRKVK